MLRASIWAQDGHDFLFFGRHQRIDVGMCLSVNFCTSASRALVVFCSFLVLTSFLTAFVGIAAQVAHGDRVFTPVASELGHFLAALFAHGGMGHGSGRPWRPGSDPGRFRGWPFQSWRPCSFPGLNADGARVDQAPRWPPGSEAPWSRSTRPAPCRAVRGWRGPCDFLQVVLERCDGLVHLGFSGFLDIGNRHDFLLGAT